MYLAGSDGSTFAATRSWTSGPTFVAPHAMWAFCPSTTPGTPGKLPPATSYGHASSTTAQCSPFTYQMDGIEIPRCGSLARSAPPVADICGATTQSFEPRPRSDAMPSPLSRPAIRSAPDPAAATARQPSACSGVGAATPAGGVEGVPVIPISPGFVLLGTMTGAPSG